MRARPGRLTVAAVNRGRIGHNLHVRLGRRDLLEVKTLLPGAAAPPPAVHPARRLPLVCTVGNHEELGMYGTLTVR